MLGYYDMLNKSAVRNLENTTWQALDVSLSCAFIFLKSGEDPVDDGCTQSKRSRKKIDLCRAREILCLEEEP
jgi:hypothetical protein